MSNSNMASPSDEPSTNQNAAVTTPDAAPAQTETLTRDETVNLWLKQHILPLEYTDEGINITVQDFLYLLETAESNYRNSWLTDDQIHTPMVLQLRGNIGRTKMIVAPPSAATLLAALGQGLGDTDGFAAQAPGTLALMEDSGTRWVVFLCNDAMGEYSGKSDDDKDSQKESASPPGDEEKEKATPGPSTTLKAKKKINPHNAKSIGKKQEETVQVAPVTTQHKSTNSGCHWGMMIIDRDNDDARFFDGNLIRVNERKNGRNKTYMRSRLGAAKAAGKILRGYDAVMGKEEGLFKTGTLQHVPLDHKDNSYKGDEGSSCGPWVFAMFRYLLQMPALLSNEGGLKKAFRRSQRQRHVNQLAFNSKQVRRDMQDLVAKEMRKHKSTNTLPYQLNTQILNSLGAPTPRHLLSRVKSLVGGTSQRQSGGTHAYRGENKSDHDESDGDDDDSRPDLYQDKLFKRLGISLDPSVIDQGTMQQIIEALDLFIATQNSSNDLRSGEKSNTDEAAKSGDTSTRSALLALADSTAFEAIANQAVAFAPMNEEEVNQWASQNTDGGFLPADMGIWQKKMFLQAAFGGFQKLDKGDAALFREGLRLDTHLSHQDIQEALFASARGTDTRLGNIKCYPAYYLREHKVLPAADAGTSNEAAFINNANVQNHVPVIGTQDGPSNNSADSDGKNGNDKDDSNKSNKGKSNKKSDVWKHTHNKPVGLYEFHTMDEAEIEKTWKMTDVRLNPIFAGKSVNSVSRRSLLFTTVQGGDFSDENDYNCINLWLKDTVVFSDRDRRDLQEYPGLIRTRMESHYRPAMQLDVSAGQDDGMYDYTSDLTEVEPSPSPTDSSFESDAEKLKGGKRKYNAKDDDPKNARPSKKTKSSTLDLEANPDEIADDETSNNNTVALHRRSSSPTVSSPDSPNAVQEDAPQDPAKSPPSPDTTPGTSENNTGGDMFTRSYKGAESGLSNTYNDDSDSDFSDSSELSDPPESLESPTSPEANGLSSNKLSKSKTPKPATKPSTTGKSKKRNHEAADDDAETETSLAKKPRNGTLPSNKLKELSSSHDSDGDGSPPATGSQTKLSFDSQATVEDSATEKVFEQMTKETEKEEKAEKAKKTKKTEKAKKAEKAKEAEKAEDAGDAEDAEDAEKAEKTTKAKKATKVENTVAVGVRRSSRLKKPTKKYGE